MPPTLDIPGCAIPHVVAQFIVPTQKLHLKHVSSIFPVRNFGEKIDCRATYSVLVPIEVVGKISLGDGTQVSGL